MDGSFPCAGAAAFGVLRDPNVQHHQNDAAYQEHGDAQATVGRWDAGVCPVEEAQVEGETE